MVYMLCAVMMRQYRALSTSVKCHVFAQIRFRMQFMYCHTYLSISIYPYILYWCVTNVKCDSLASIRAVAFLFLTLFWYPIIRHSFILFIYIFISFFPLHSSPLLTHFHLKCVYVCNLSHLTMTMMIMDTEP